jgi:hypothetical protein
MALTRTTLLPFLILLLVAGCASSTGSDSMRATTEPPSVPGGPTLVRIPVEFDDYVIRMPATVPPGEAHFDVKNVGHHAHRLKLTGNGVDADMDHNLAPGEAGTLDAPLAAGTYRATCPVGPHAMLGMKRTLKVSP